MTVKSVILAGVVGGWEQSSIMVWDELHRSGTDSLERGDYSSAQRYLIKAVADAENDQANLATSLYSLGQVYAHLQDYQKAEAALTRALSIRGKVLGLEHPEVARVIDELGLVQLNQQNYSQSEPLLRRSLDMRKKLLGDKHPEVAESMVSVASFCESQKKPQEAEMLLNNALRLQEEVLDAYDVKMAPTLGLLAVHAFNKKDFAQAETFARRALALREAALGTDHPDVAMSLHVLAMISLAQKDFVKAESAYRRALTIREKYLPPTHSGISSVLKHLGISYYCQGKYAEAEEIYSQLDSISESAGNTADMLVAWRQRSWIRLRERKLADCENYTQMCLQRMKERGIEDKDSKNSLVLCLFSCYVAQKNYLMAAKALPGTAFAVGKRLLDGNSPSKKGIKKPRAKAKSAKN